MGELDGEFEEDAEGAVDSAGDEWKLLDERRLYIITTWHS
jgi:hypothetical protein